RGGDRGHHLRTGRRRGTADVRRAPRPGRHRRAPARLDVAGPPAGRPRVANYAGEAETHARPRRTPRTAPTTRTAEETHP
ncbi:hypothetical protein ABT237_36075, partial [Streptomyces sp. NPDC001581]